MTSAERRLVVGVCVVLGTALFSTATFNYIVTPMMDALDATESQQSLLRQLPSIGALLVIFVAGVVGPLVGPRRFVFSCGLAMALGYAIVLVSPAMPVTSLGLLIGSIGQQGLFVVTIGLLSSKLADPESRASGFASLAMVSPFVYLVGPVVAGGLVGLVGWRFVVALWCIAALAAAVSAARMLPADDDSAGSRVELWTPALAGFALACVVQTVNNVSEDGWTAAATLGWLFAGICASVVLVVLMRRLERPSLDIAVLRHGGFRLLLVVVMLVPFASLSYYAMLGLQYIYGYDEFQSAVLMVPAQLTSVAGAWISGRLIRRRGIRFAGTAALVAVSLALFLTLTQTVTLPVVACLAVVCLYSGAMTAANAPLTNSVMDLAPKGAEGSAAAFRGASGSLGSAIGVVMMSTVVFTAFQASLTSQLQGSGDDASQVAAITGSLRDQVSSEQVASQYSVPLTEVDTIGVDQKQALVDGYRIQGVAGGVIVLLAAGIFFAYRGPNPGASRKDGQRRARSASPGLDSGGDSS